MAIQINGTTVIDNSRNLTNIVSYGGPGVATQAEAEAGTNNNQLMTPLRVKQAIDSAGGSVINRIQRGTSSYSPGGAVVPITSVNTGKAFISATSGGVTKIGSYGPIYGSTPLQYSSSGYATLSASSVTAKSDAGVVLRPYPQGGPWVLSQNGTLSWEVIEFT
jgi:hypothetical protein